jgi:hypothetical protein
MLSKQLIGCGKGIRMKNEIVAAQDEVLTRTTTLQKYYTQRGIVNADFAQNIMRQ